jgi:hypothetical protein
MRNLPRTVSAPDVRQGADQASRLSKLTIRVRDANLIILTRTMRVLTPN